jgi:L,D-transpeptidase ErfK/SrfK
LADIARRHGLGYEDIVRANPGLQPWLPGEGAQVILPTQFVLPPGPREGVVLNVAEYRLYYYPVAKSGEPRYVMTYPISIGRMDWETPLGMTEIVAKVVDPAWYPPQSVRDEHAADGKPLPTVVPAGPDNPLGRFAMRLSMPGYLIHSTNRPAGVGMRVSHGCIRMFPEDIEFLFGLVGVSTKVRIINAPLKFGWRGDELLMESHPLLVASDVDRLNDVTELYISATGERAGELDWHLAEEVVGRADGIPTTVGAGIKNAATSAASE